jgi:sodium/hydrogen antiporter
MLFRRLPAIFATYKLMPSCIRDWKEALFMGYFGPIGIGAVFYVEHAKHLFPDVEDAQTEEERNLIRVMVPVVYWLVLFSIVVHGLSIPALNAFYVWKGVEPVRDEDGPVEVKVIYLSICIPRTKVLTTFTGTIGERSASEQRCRFEAWICLREQQVLACVQHS